MAGVRLGAARTRRCSPPLAGALVEELLGLAAGVVGVDAGSGSPTRRAGSEFWRTRPARDRGGGAMISFVRHGETAHNRDGRLQGRVDLELSERGLEQAARARAAVRGATLATRGRRARCARAAQTAAAIAAVCGVRRSRSTTA